jgi:hypothetical protein
MLLLAAIASGQWGQQHGSRNHGGKARSSVGEFHDPFLARLGIICAGPSQSHEMHSRRSHALHSCWLPMGQRLYRRGISHSTLI